MQRDDAVVLRPLGLTPRGLAGDGPVRRGLDLCELDGRLAVVTDHPSPAAQRVAVIDTGPMTPPPAKLVPGAG